MVLEQLDNLCGKGGEERTRRKGRERQEKEANPLSDKELDTKHTMNSHNSVIRKQSIQFLKTEVLNRHLKEEI